MKLIRAHKLLIGTLCISLLLVFFLNISLGSVAIPVPEIFKGLLGQSFSKSSWEFIVLNYRLPKAITATLAGSGLAVSGLLMQTLFRNPLAGPFVLGISSGASLGVAILVLGSGVFTGFLGTLYLHPSAIVIAAALGSFLVLLAVMLVSLRIKDTMALLIIGLMFGSITSAVVGILSYFSSAEQLQNYIFWSFGSFGNLSWNEVTILLTCCCIGFLLCIASSKSLNALLLGENYAKSMGIQIKKVTFLCIIATSILAGGITAFTGPIAFIGLAVPHITKQFIKTSNHFILFPSVMLLGGILMLLCDTIAQLPFSEYTLPINAITSIVGAPVVIWLLVKKRKLIF